MGVLAPLYLAGLAALSVPLILHLVRRTPRGRQTFSSLMFLTPSPPRLTRRSRLDQILLLLLRLGALALLALAFARPFLREAATLATSDLPKRRVAILLDASASMRRADLWQQALAAANKELDELAPHDDVALFTFTDTLQTVIDFDAAADQASATRADVLRQQLKKLRPTWGTGDLGAALATVAGELDSAGDAQQLVAELQIVLISDFQMGSRIEALQAMAWPERVRVIARQVKPKRPSNAYVHLLPSEEDAADAQPRVRVVNAADSSADQFFIAWASSKLPPNRAPTKTAETAIYVPPGQSRVVRLPRPEAAVDADRIVLRGDDHDFDNTHYVVPVRRQEVKLVYLGSDPADDVEGAQYYLRLAVAGDLLRQVEVQAPASNDAKSLMEALPPQLVVATRELSAQLVDELKQYVERGGTLLLAPGDAQAAKSLPHFFSGVELGEEKQPSENDFSLLGEIDFTHPLFASFASPRYSDFTKIHFWRHRAIVIPPPSAETAPATALSPSTVNVVARFDNGNPAVLERTLGKGRVLALASGWDPDDSQLALSSKFVPLVGNLLDLACGGEPAAAGVTVNEPVPLSAAERRGRVVRKPDGRDVKVAADAKIFDETDEPGIYHALELEAGSSDEMHFAVNLAAVESNTTPLDLEQLEQLGVRMGTDLTRAERLQRIRQQRDTELESRQKVWRWLLVGVLGLIVVETWWAGRAARQTDVRQMDAQQSDGRQLAMNTETA